MVGHKTSMMDGIRSAYPTRPAEGEVAFDTSSVTDLYNMGEAYNDNKATIESINMFEQEATIMMQDIGEPIPWTEEEQREIDASTPAAPVLPPPVEKQAPDYVYTEKDNIAARLLGDNFDSIPKIRQDEIVEEIGKGGSPRDVIKYSQQKAGLTGKDVDGYVGEKTVLALDPSIILEGKKEKDMFTLLGAKAITAVETIEGPLSKQEKYVLEKEAFVTRKYLDSKGVVTSGVGQTGKWMSRGYKEAFKAHENVLKRLVPNYVNENVEMQSALMSLMYRGDVVWHYDWVENLRAGEYKEAAINLLDNADYVKSKAANTGVYKRMDEAAEIISRQKFKK